MTVKGGSRPACAACRFQRRRCSADCPLAPFFPANQPKLFQNVHSLYGVGHILKILSQLEDDEQKEEAMKSIQYESNIRQIHKVHGCYGLIVHLQQKMVESVQELRHLRLLIEAYRRKNVNVVQSDVAGSSDWVSGMINGGGDLGFYYNVGDHNVGYENWDDQTKTAIDEFQQFCSVGDDQESSGYKETMAGSSSFVDDQQAFLGSKEPYDMKMESLLKDTPYVNEPGELKPER
ncbi:putative transcription factor AS2-LOB family [Helianthus annuus]|nr:putative transcription factor AS2-LOB family [Helianthus annuus]